MELPTTYYICFPQPLTRQQLKVTQKSNFNRRRASADLEARADLVWKGRVRDNPHLFNGSKFRYAGMTVVSGELVTQQEGKLALLLPDSAESLTEVEIRTGYSNYKEYTTTNMSVDAEAFVKHGIDKYNDQQACMADIIGHSALLLTSDNFVVIQLRSQTVGEACGMWHFPGGHPEPEELGITCTEDMLGTESRKIVDEIYISLLREMKEELNLSEDELSDPVLVAIGKDKETHYKPEFNFIIRTELTAQQISEKYYAEDFFDPESDDIGFWDISQLNLSGKLCFSLCKFKTNEPEFVIVDVDLVANSSVQLVQNLQIMMNYNPALLT